MLRAVVLTIPACGRQTDGQTDGIAAASTALAMRALRRAVKIHGHLLCRLMFCFRCSAEGQIEVATSTRSLGYYYQLVLENKNWMDAQRYCEKVYRASLLVTDDEMDVHALKQYLDPLLGQLACRLIFVFYSPNMGQ